MHQQITTNTLSIDVREIFLSHTGKDKFFAEVLFHRLKDSNYKCFFDKETLHKGKPLSEILKVLEHCRMAVVVLSQDFIQNFWPMLELERIVCKMLAKDGAAIYPIFFGIQPSDLTNKSKLSKWRKKWETFIHKNEGHNFNIDIWPEALKKLKSCVGTIINPQEKNDCYRFVDIVVHEIRKILPPSPEPYCRNNRGIEGWGTIAKSCSCDIVVHEIQKILPPSLVLYCENNSDIEGSNKDFKEHFQEMIHMDVGNEKQILGLYGIDGNQCHPLQHPTASIEEGDEHTMNLEEHELDNFGKRNCVEHLLNEDDMIIEELIYVLRF